MPGRESGGLVTPYCVMYRIAGGFLWGKANSGNRPVLVISDCYKSPFLSLKGKAERLYILSEAKTPAERRSLGHR